MQAAIKRYESSSPSAMVHLVKTKCCIASSSWGICGKTARTTYLKCHVEPLKPGYFFFIYLFLHILGLSKNKPWSSRPAADAHATSEFYTLVIIYSCEKSGRFRFLFFFFFFICLYSQGTRFVTIKNSHLYIVKDLFFFFFWLVFR